MTILSALIYLLVGSALLAFPYQGVLSLTILLIFLFLVQGLINIALGIEWWHMQNSGWLILNGVLTLALAILVYLGWPQSASWVIGLLVGINMFFFGFSLMTLGWALPKNPA